MESVMIRMAQPAHPGRFIKMEIMSRSISP